MADWRERLAAQSQRLRILQQQYAESEADDDWWHAKRRRRAAAAAAVEEDDEHGRRRGGSRPGRIKSLARDREGGTQRWRRQYWGANPVYADAQFERRHCMSRHLFERVLRDVCNHNSYFHQKPDAVHKLGHSSEIKMAAALRRLARGAASDDQDDRLEIGESTVDKCLEEFCKTVIAVYSGK